MAFRLEPSRRLVAFIVLTAAATVSLVAFMPLPHLPRLAAIAWCALACAHALAIHAREREVTIADGTFIVVDGREGVIIGGSFVAPWLTIVRWRPVDSRFGRSVVVLPDMIDPEAFRALRVILRWAPPR